jgi:glycosyltransferase involved in cell wall biosynthesis
MRVALAYGDWCLSFRKTLELTTARADPRGLSGSEYGYLRIAEELARMGHDVTAYTTSSDAGKTHEGVKVADIAGPIEPCDAFISINEPDLCRRAPAGAFRVCLQWVNDTSYCKAHVEDFVDLWCSPSAAHLAQFMTNPAWHRVEVTGEHPNGKATYKPDPSKWAAVQLGCDPEKLGPHGSGPEGMSLPREKIPGRVIYCSSPDRGLHWLLQEWPAIRKAVPHAELRIFYRLEPWLRQWDTTPFYPAIEPLRQRAIYIEECLRRLKGHGVTVLDSVSRETIEHEMSVAECLAYPANTTTWSEGFSCTIAEACAAQAAPVITDCDALGSVYASIDPVPMQGDWVPVWRDKVILVLTDSEFRADLNKRARALGESLTWRKTTDRLVKLIEERRT